MKGWRQFGRAALVALIAFFVIVTFLPLWWTDLWWVRAWDFPRLQVAAILLGLAAGAWFAAPGRWRWPLLGAIAAALAWQLSHFLAFFPPYPKAVASVERCPAERQLSLLNANVLMTNRDYGALLDMAERHRPDVLLLLETDEGWAEAIAPLRKLYPHVLSEVRGNTYGLVLLSRLPMEGRIRHLVQQDVPSAKVSIRLRGGQPVLLHAVHPEPPVPGDDSGERDAELVLVGREVRDDGRAAIVIGDLNDVGWSRTSRLFREVAGMSDSRVGRGFYPTFNANYPLLRWPLDHLFVSPHFELMEIALLPDIGSDHLPIFFRVCLKEDASKRKVAPDADPATEAEASAEVQSGVEEKQEEDGGR